MSIDMNISHHYDDDADILYIDFGSNEPCFSEEIDGFVMIDVGWFSKLPQGIQVISPRARRLRAVNLRLIVQQVEAKCKALMEQQAKQIHSQEPILHNVLGNVLSQAFAAVN